MAQPKGGGKGASAKQNLKRNWPEAAASWERAAPAQAPAQAAKGSGKKKGKRELRCFHCQEPGHVAGACPKKAAGQPAVPRAAAKAAA